MTTFTVHIKASNALFCNVDGRTEVIRLLRGVISKLDYVEYAGTIRDINDNRVGEWKFTSDDDDDDDSLGVGY